MNILNKSIACLIPSQFAILRAIGRDEQRFFLPVSSLRYIKHHIKVPKFLNFTIVNT